MELDFSELESIATQTAINEFTEPLGTEEGNYYTQEAEKPARSQNRAPYHQLDNELQERARIREMYSQYQENIKRASGLRSEILKGVQEGRPAEFTLKGGTVYRLYDRGHGYIQPM